MSIERNPAAVPDTPPPRPFFNGKPVLELPCDGRPIGMFAADLGTMLAHKDIFTRNGCAFVVNAEGQKLELANPTWLRTWAEQHVACFKSRKMQQGEVFRPLSTMTEDTARAVLLSPQFLERLRRLERFQPCRMPIIRADGTLELLPEGYDEASATYTAPGIDYKLDATLAEARQTIESAFAEFPFADGGRSKAVAIGAMLTVFAGGLLPSGATRPVFQYFGNAEGTGKTTCARLAGIAYGAVAAEAAPTDESEWQKKLLSAVIGGRRLLLLDNLKGHLNSPALEAYTTASTYGGRILGVSKEFVGEAGATVLITGNQLTISPDMRRRSLVVELFMPELRAEDRTFKRRLDDPALLEMRPSLLAACWALVRDWNEHGRPAASRMNSSFPRWCDMIGGIVEHAGFGCATAPAEIEGMGDTDTGDIAKLASVIDTGTCYSFSELSELCAEHGLFVRFTEAKDDDKSAKSAFSKLLKRYDRRTIGPGVVFQIEGKGKSRLYLAKNASKTGMVGMVSMVVEDY